MRGSTIAYAICAILFHNQVSAQVGVPAPVLQQQDEVRSREGVVCRSGNNRPTLDVGVSGTNSSQHSQQILSFAGYQGTSATVFARVSMPLGAKYERLDCNRLYELEIERLKMEIDQLKSGKASAVIIR